jgi:enterochelin esterase-like enzyme
VLFRLAGLIAVQAGALAFIFLVVNYQFGFYSSWSDLLGKSTGGGTVLGLNRGPISQSAQLVVYNSAPVQLKGAKTASGRLDRIMIRGALSGMTATGNVYLPPGYPAPHRSYPVVLVLARATAGSPYAARQLATDAATAIVAGKMLPTILVSLAIPAADPGCLNVPGGDQAALFFAQDVPAAIGAQFRVASTPAGWAILGDQAGGYCALQLALTSASSFTAAALPPGTYEVPPGGFPANTVASFRLADNLLWLFRHYPMQPVSVLFTGTGSTPFRSQARLPMRASAIRPYRGAAALTPVLEWLRARLAAATAA